MKNLTRFIVAILILLTFHLPVEAQNKKVKVITTLHYLQSITQAIGGDRVEVVALSNPKQDPHYVTPTPRMNQLATDADLFIENGLSLDLWAKNVVDASGNPSIQSGNPGHLIATVNAPVQELPTEVSRSWGDIHPQGNPHIWLDPLNAKIIAENIADRLSQLDPVHSEEFLEHLNDFRNRIDRAMFGDDLVRALGPSGGDILTRKARNHELMEWLSSKKLGDRLGGWMKKAAPLAGMKLMSYHKTYIYFADRFGFRIVGELEEKPGIPPPPRHRDAVVEQVKREGIRLILNDNFYSRDAADYVAAKTGARVVITYLDVDANENVTSYEKLIGYLLDEIAQPGAEAK